MSRLPDRLLTPTDVRHHLYCPRLSYFRLVLGIQEPPEPTALVRHGTAVHERKAAQDRGHRRARLEVVEKRKNVVLVSERIGLSGQVDELLFLADGTAAPLDHKFSRWPGFVRPDLKAQLACYGMLVKDIFGRQVRAGYLVFTRSSNRLVRVAITDDDYLDLLGTLYEMNEVIGRGLFPGVEPCQAKCRICYCRNVCGG